MKYGDKAKLVKYNLISEIQKFIMQGAECTMIINKLCLSPEQLRDL